MNENTNTSMDMAIGEVKFGQKNENSQQNLTKNIVVVYKYITDRPNLMCYILLMMIICFNYTLYSGEKRLMKYDGFYTVIRDLSPLQLFVPLIFIILILTVFLSVVFNSKKLNILFLLLFTLSIGMVGSDTYQNTANFIEHFNHSVIMADVRYSLEEIDANTFHKAIYSRLKYIIYIADDDYDITYGVQEIMNKQPVRIYYYKPENEQIKQQYNIDKTPAIIITGTGKTTDPTQNNITLTGNSMLTELEAVIHLHKQGRIYYTKRIK